MIGNHQVQEFVNDHLVAKGCGGREHIKLGTLRRRTKELVYTGWFALFGYVLLDDSLQLHERTDIEFGSYVNAETLLGLPAGTVGELLFFGVMAFILFTVIAMLWKRNRSTDPLFPAAHGSPS